MYKKELYTPVCVLLTGLYAKKKADTEGISFTEALYEDEK